MTWQQQAACAPCNRPEGMTEQEWTAQWFPGRGHNATAAKTICFRCPVKADCLQAALEAPYGEPGVWGGMSEKQRRGLGTVRVRTSGHGTEAGYRTHLRDGQDPCQWCRGAHNAAERRRRLERLTRNQEVA